MNPKGFTLTEVLVTGLLIAVLAGGILAFFGFSAQQARQGSSHSLLQIYAEGVADQVARTTRAAGVVLNQATGETFANWNTYTGQQNTSQVLIYNEAGTVTGGYWLNPSGVLQEFNPATGVWADYRAGAEAVQYAAGSAFIVFPGRNSLTLDLRLVRAANGITDTMALKEAYYTCRNIPKT